jgi:hypothetical protein
MLLASAKVLVEKPYDLGVVAPLDPLNPVVRRPSTAAWMSPLTQDPPTILLEFLESGVGDLSRGTTCNALQA